MKQKAVQKKQCFLLLFFIIVLGKKKTVVLSRTLGCGTLREIEKSYSKTNTKRFTARDQIQSIMMRYFEQHVGVRILSVINKLHLK